MKLKKIYCYMLVIILVINAPIIVYADSAPGTVTVEGGSIGSGGVEGNSNILKGTALTVLMATLANVGIQVKVAADDYAHGKGAFAYLEDKFNEWESKSSVAWDAYEAFNSTKVGQDGTLYVNAESSSIMQKFLNWLLANNSVIPEGELAAGPGGAFMGVRWTAPNGHYYEFTDSNIGYMVAIKSNSSDTNWRICAFRNTSFQLHAVEGQYGYTGTSDSTTVNGWYRYFGSKTFSENNITGLLDLSALGYYGSSGFATWLRSIGDSPAVNVGQTGFYGDITDIPQLVDETGNGKILIVQPGLMGQVQDSYVGSNNASVNIQDYLDALRDLYGQMALPQDIADLPDITIPGEDAITGAKEDVAVIDRDIVLDQDITLPADEDAITWPEVPEVAVSVADPSVPSNPDVSIPAMSLDLTQYFPFCLPFDIYHILQKLDADPVTPEVTVDWGNILGAFGIDYVMHLDLHDYDDLAELLRNMETAAFVVGLAVVTRQMFLRG